MAKRSTNNHAVLGNSFLINNYDKTFVFQVSDLMRYTIPAYQNNKKGGT
jgi:hypothetical protein